jgi:dienelactone hydrolase
MIKAGAVWLALAATLCGVAPGFAAGTAVSFTPVGGSETIPATLLMPDGAGPFPAVVVAHDCSGLGPRSSGAPGRWAQLLFDQGYVAIVPDSFTPRGLPQGTCLEARASARVANGAVRAADAYGALAFLRALPQVDGARVGIMGGSHGGWTTLAAMYEPTSEGDPLFPAKRAGFAAAVALYPGCGNNFGAWSVTRTGSGPGPVTGYSGVYKPIAPVLILIGELDDWTPAEPCRRLVEASRAAGYPMELKIYPGAHHSFDNNNPVRFVAARTNFGAPGGHGATTGGDPTAWADAKKEVEAFFDRNIKKIK